MNEKFKATLKLLDKWESHGRKKLSNGAIQICNVPSIAPEAWLHEIFPPLNDEQINELQKKVKLQLPNDYIELLKYCNGINLFFGSLCVRGLRSQMNYRSGDLAVQPYALEQDQIYLTTKNTSFICVGSYGYDVSHITFDLDEGIDNNKVYRCERRKPVILNEWPDLWTCLYDEVQRLSNHFDDMGVRLDKSIPTIPESQVIK